MEGRDMLRMLGVLAICAVIQLSACSRRGATTIVVLIPSGYSGSLVVVEDRSRGIDPRDSVGRVVLDFRIGNVIRVRDLSVLGPEMFFVASVDGRPIRVMHPLLNPAPNEVVFQAGGEGSQGQLRWANFRVGTVAALEKMDGMNWGRSMSELLKEPGLLRYRGE